MFGLFKKPPPLPPPEPSVAFAEEVIAIFIIVGLAWVIKRTHDEKHLNLHDILHYFGDMMEAALYSFCYFLFALYFGGIIEDVMPKYSSHTTYWCLLGEVLMQAMCNSIVSQMTIDLMQRIPIPDLGFEGKGLAARNGGIIFGTSLFARQNNFKAKVAAIAALEDKIFYLGFPSKFLPFFVPK